MSHENQSPQNYVDDQGSQSQAIQRPQWQRWSGVVPHYIRSACFLWQFIKFSLMLFLAIRQRLVLNERRHIPNILVGKILPENFERARTYRKAENAVAMFSGVYLTIHEIWMIHISGYTGFWFLSGPTLDTLGFWPPEWDRETGESIIFIAIMIVHRNSVSLPLNLWKTFVVEEAYGFNKMSFMAFMWDWAKLVIVEAVYAIVTGICILWIVKETGKMFFIWLWIFSVLWVIISMTVYPNYIAPIFDSYTHLREGRLKHRLKRLANFLDFPLEDILVLHQSWRSEHRSAYFFGLMGSKKIVLYDTLLTGYPEADETTSVLQRRSVFIRNKLRASHNKKEGRSNMEDTEESSEDDRSKRPGTGYTEYEIEAIVAKLMGRWVLGHSLRELAFPILNMFCFYFIFSLLYQNSSLFEAFSLPKEIDKPVLLGLRILLQDCLDIYIIIIGTVMKHLSRQHQYEADAFATKLGYGEDLIEAYIETEKENLDYPYFDSWYWNFHHGEPSILDCINAIEKEIERLEWKVD